MSANGRERASNAKPFKATRKFVSRKVDLEDAPMRRTARGFGSVEDWRCIAISRQHQQYRPVCRIC